MTDDVADDDLTGVSRHYTVSIYIYTALSKDLLRTENAVYVLGLRFAREAMTNSHLY